MIYKMFRSCLFGLLLIYTFIPHATSIITVAPTNKLAALGSSVTIECTISGTPLAWQLLKLGSALPTSISTTDTNQRVHIDNTGGKFNLVITNVQNGDAGTYVCQESDQTGKASYLAVLVTSSATTDHTTGAELVSGTVVKTTCSASFIATNMLLKIDITDGTNSQSATSAENTGSTAVNFQAAMDVTASLPQVPQATCKYTFSLKPGGAQTDVDSSDTNTYTIARPAITVSECAKATEITPKLDTYVPGQALKCAYTGYPTPPTFRWVDKSTAQTLATTETLTLSTSLPLNQQITYQCFVKNTLQTVTCTENSVEHTFTIELSTTAAPVTQGSTTPRNETASAGIKWNNIYLIPILLIPLLLLLLGLLTCLLCGVFGPVSEICKLPRRKPKPQKVMMEQPRGTMSFYQAQDTKGRMDPTFRPQQEPKGYTEYRYPSSYSWMDPNDAKDIETFNNMGYVGLGSTQSVYTAHRNDVF